MKIIEKQKMEEENEKRVESEKQNAFRNHATAIR